jgi:xylulose-5-phosphate/fructose-6-phosphate phosphoketolase
MLNDMDRFHLVMDVIDRVPSLGSSAAVVRQNMTDARVAHRAWTREHGDDRPDLSGWTWPHAPSGQDDEVVAVDDLVRGTVGQVSGSRAGHLEQSC